MGAAVACFAACAQDTTPHPAGITDCQGSATQCGLGSRPNGTVPTGGTGADASSDGATGTACGNLSSPIAACEACLEQTCCTQAITCSNNAECFALTSCLKSCQPTDQPCITGCQNLHTTGLPAYNGYVACLQTNCSVPCQLVDAGATNCGQFVFSVAACDNCVTTNCCAPANVCSSDPDCFSLGNCLQSCLPTDTLCQSNCRMLLPAGTGTYAALGLCISSNCAAQCQ